MYTIFLSIGESIDFVLVMFEGVPNIFAPIFLAGLDIEPKKVII